MQEITVISGKGGTGKTSLTAALAALSNNTIITDCDVDAPNLHLLLPPKNKHSVEFLGSKLASINPDKCTECGECQAACKFNAINPPVVSPIFCEGCSVCLLVCPEKAITLNDRVAGYTYVSKTAYGTMVHAKLKPGEANSGKLVTTIRKIASQKAVKQNLKLILNDGPPGIGCPVIASITGVTHALIVVEPSISGIHDLKRVLKLAKFFRIKTSVCVNKYDLNEENTSLIHGICKKNRILLAGKIPFDPLITKALRMGKPIVEYAPHSVVTREIKGLWETIKNHLFS